MMRPASGPGTPDVASVPYPTGPGSVQQIAFGIARRDLISHLGSIVERVQGTVRITWRASHIQRDRERAEIDVGQLTLRLIVEATAAVTMQIAGVDTVNVSLAKVTGPATMMKRDIALRLGRPGPDAAMLIPHYLPVELSHALPHTDPEVEIRADLREYFGTAARSRLRPAPLVLDETRVWSLPLRDIISRSPALGASSRSTSKASPASDPVIVIMLWQRTPDGRMLEGIVEVRVALEPPPPPLLVCVDLGTSAITAWFGPTSETEMHVQGDYLPLGQFVRDLTGEEHEEYVRDRSPADNTLLPNLVGLEPVTNMRARFAPLSYGDASLALRDHEGAARRLRSLGRCYDVSLPFLPRQDLPRYRDTVVREPKREMMREIVSSGLHRDMVLRGEIPSVEGGQFVLTRNVKFAALFADLFHELGSFLVPRTLRLIASLKGQEPLLHAWLYGGDQIGVVASLPSGVPAEVRDC